MHYAKRIFVVILLIYMVFGLILFIFQRKFIYFPSSQDFSSCVYLKDSEKVTYEGTRMYVHKSTDDWVIIYHGNGGSACDRSHYLNYFNPNKFSYIIVEYSGYSGDSTSPSQSALMKNVEATNSYLKKQGVASKIILGESLGTAPASYHYYLNPSNKLILISPFDSLVSVTQSHYLFYPIKLMLLDTYPSSEWLKNADNVLIIHGTNDDIVPIRFGKSLFDSIPGHKKTFVEIPGFGHNDIHNNITTENTIIDFIIK